MEGKRYIEGRDQRQGTFLPECLDEIIGAENPVRFIRVYVESLDGE